MYMVQCVNCCHFNYKFWECTLFPGLSIQQQTRGSWVPSIRKATPWHNLFLQNFGNNMLYCRHSRWKFKYKDSTVFDTQTLSNMKSLLRIWKQLEESNSDYESRPSRKPHSDPSDKERTFEYVCEILAIIENFSSKSIRFIDKDMAMSELLIRVVMHEDFRYFSFKIRKGQFL